MSETYRDLRSPCTRCGCVEGIFTQQGEDTKATCRACGAYCYFAPKSPEEKTPPANRRKPWTETEKSKLAALQGTAEPSEFFASLLAQYEKHGGLTEPQWQALGKATDSRPAAAKDPQCSFCNDDPADRGPEGKCACTEEGFLGEKLLRRLIDDGLIHTGLSRRPWTCSRCSQSQNTGVVGFSWRLVRAPGNATTCCATCTYQWIAVLAGP